MALRRNLPALWIVMALSCGYPKVRLEWLTATLGAPTCPIEPAGIMRHRLFCPVTTTDPVKVTFTVEGRGIQLAHVTVALGKATNPPVPVLLEGRVEGGDLLTVSISVDGREIERKVCRVRETP